MSSIGSILSVARTALLSHQAAMEVTGHNIANAETPGYTRQTLSLEQGPVRKMTYGIFGSGVRIATVGRAREMLLDQDVRTQLAPAGYSSTRRDALVRVEQIFGEPSDNGLAAAFDAFWNSWSDLSAQPNNAGARAVVRQRAEALIQRFNSYANELQRMETDTRTQASTVLEQVNQLTTSIAAINKQIVPMESGGNTANDLRDERDRLLDELGTLVPITVIDRADGGNQVMLGGRPLVDGVFTNALELTVTIPQEIRIAGETSPVRTMGGKLGALVELANVDIAGTRAELDALAAALITDVNALHTTGWSPTAGVSGNWDPLLGPTGSGISFFDADPTALSAGGIRLSAEVAADAGAIAASATLQATGDNAVALAIGELRDGSPSAVSGSFGGAFQRIIATIAGAGRAAGDAATVSNTLLAQSSARRDSVTGVSTDEELMRLMRHQQAYAAAAKVVQTVDEMMETLISLKR
ncbi:MAG: flagellar hook-associated protein FlgK [Gemmatimonadaceae bacterium]|nr:flagellar hook-associated protein FlgK [Gemmatimonadaceae bacterium]